MNKSDQKFSLQSYRTPELFETVKELVSIPGAFRKLAGWCMFGGFVMLIIAVVAFFSGWIQGLWAVFFCAYSLFFGVVGGLAVGIADVIRRSSAGMLKLVDLLFGVTEQVAKDFRNLSSGDQKLPPTRELVQMVYADVILPVVENAVGGMLGFLGQPVLWIYRQSLGRAVHAAIKLIPVEATKEEEQKLEEAKDGMKNVAGAIAQREEKILGNLQKARKAVAGIGGTLRAVVMIPCYIVFTLLLLVLIVPFVVLILLSSGTPPAEPETAMRVTVDALRQSRAYASH
ncbi:MAG: hypothetical protein AAF456_11180 [Planctomycetota bacterium]